MNIEADFDIYGDLESSIFTISNKRTKTTDKETDEKLQTLTKEVEKLKAKNKILKKENQTICTNLSSLFLTAKTDIEKKNFIIKQLQEKLKEHTLNGAKKLLSRSEVEENLRIYQEACNETRSKMIVDEINKIVHQMKSKKRKSKTLRDKSKKEYKFGNNMSLYLCKEQIPFGRKANVVILNETKQEKK